MEGNYGKRIAAGVAGLLVLFGAIFFWPLTSIPAGHVGLVSLFGNVQQETLAPGLHVINPMAHVMDFNVQQRKLSVNGEVGTRDLQSVHAQVTVNYTPSGSGAVSLYTGFGTNYADVIIPPAAQDRLKAVTSHFTAEELITKREEVRSKARTAITEAIRERSNGAIAVNDVVIADFGFVASFKQAIEAKQVAEQAALTEKNNADKAKWLAQQAIETARGQAAAFTAQSAAITPQMIQMEWIRKWNGTLPQYQLGTSGATPLISLPSRP